MGWLFGSKAGAKKAAKKKGYKQGKADGKGFLETAKDTLSTTGDILKAGLKASPYVALGIGGALLGRKLAQSSKPQ